MNPLAALVPDWRKKKKAMADGKPVDLSVPGMGPSAMPPPKMNRAQRRYAEQSLRRYLKKHGHQAR